MVLFVQAAQAVPIAPGIVDSDSPILVYNGSWMTVTNPAAVGGSVESTSDGSVTFDLYTSGFTLFWITGVNAAIEVCIDAECVALDVSGSGEAGRGDFTGLPTGTKSVIVTPTAGNFMLDAVYIYPDPPTVEQSSGAVVKDTFDFGGESYSVAYRFSFTAGELVVISLLAFIGTIQLAGMVFQQWNQRQ